MAESVLKRDFFVKRSQMKSLLKTENYKARWFELTPIALRYCDGSIEVTQLIALFSILLNLVYDTLVSRVVDN